jgi:hypothetical protein
MQSLPGDWEYVRKESGIEGAELESDVVVAAVKDCPHFEDDPCHLYYCYCFLPATVAPPPPSWTTVDPDSHDPELEYEAGIAVVAAAAEL